MRKLSYLIVLIIVFGLIISGCIFPVVPPSGKDESIDIVKDAVFCKIDLIAGQHTVAGFITVSNDDKNLFITYETVDNWLIDETHLYVGTIIPTNSAPGKFPYKHEELGGITTDTYEIPLKDLGVGPCDKIYIAAHTDLVKGETEETGWAEGVEIEPGKNWAMYFDYRLPCTIVQEVLYIHNLAGQELSNLIEDISVISLNDILNDLGNYLEEQEGVDNVVLEDNTLQVNYKSGIISFIVLHDTSEESSLGFKDQISINSNVFEKRPKTKEEHNSKSSLLKSKQVADENIEYIHNHNILIWSPRDAELLVYNLAPGLEKLFSEANINYEVKSLVGEDADIDSLRTITEYGMIFFHTHGNGGKWLESGEEVIDDNNYETELGNGSMAIIQHYYLEISGPGNLPTFNLIKKNAHYLVSYIWFKKNINGRFPNTIIANLSCESCDFTYLWDVFHSYGAKTYFGFKGYTWCKFDRDRAYEIVEELRNGDNTTGDAYTQITDRLYGGIWWMFGSENMKFSKNTLLSIVVLPETMTLTEGDSQSIDSIIAYYENGSTANISLDACTYESKYSIVATVATGVITAINEGTTYIFVRYIEEGITKNDIVEVTVTPVTPETYTITASAGPHGSINPSGNVTVNQGSDISFTITPDAGYQIDDVLVDGSSVGAVSSYTFTNVTEDHTISATFISVAPGPVHNLTKDIYYDTIQAALDGADSGNTIEVADGTYDESITFPSGKMIILQSANGASSTIIRGNDGLPTVTFEGSLGGTTLEGFTITHADGLTGRGIHINGGTLTINGSTISDNFARSQYSNASGGGIQNGGTLTINGSTISGNYALGGGGYTYYCASGGGISNFGTLTINGSTISGNYAGGEGGSSGGGISNSGTLTIIASTISGNSAQYGGGIDNIYNVGTLTVTGSTISYNFVSYSGNGGGIYLGSTENITIGGSSDFDKNTICGNYKSGYDPSLDQQIRDDSGDLYETYKDTNYISAYCGVPSGPVHNLTKDTYYTTIQAALDDADNDNIIEVADGTYDESIAFPSYNKVVLKSVNGPSSTIIRGDGGSPTVTFINGPLEDSTLEGFTITHINGLIGKGIWNYRSNLSINNCIISNNYFDYPAATFGGGIGNEGTLTITGSTISGNYAPYGGGIENFGPLTITGSTISGNSAVCGGGIANWSTLTTITGSTISGNSAVWDGGGIYLGSYSENITIGGDSADDKNTICGNYKTEQDPSLDQQIRGDSGSLYETYKDTNYISAYCD